MEALLLLVLGWIKSAALCAGLFVLVGAVGVGITLAVLIGGYWLVAFIAALASDTREPWQFGD